MKKKSSWILTDLQIDETFFILNCLLQYYRVFSCLESVCDNFLHVPGKSVADYGSSASADMVADNQSDHSLIALYMVHDHIWSYEVGPHDVKIDKKYCQTFFQLLFGCPMANFGLLSRWAASQSQW